MKEAGVRGAFAVVALVLITMAGCGGPAPSPSPEATPRATGGVLRVGMDIVDYESFQRNEEGTLDSSWDPTTTWASGPFQLFRCCLLRTLMSYNGRALADGGAELQPDLADGYPQISADGLTWTFNIRDGVRYAPPMVDSVVKAGDFVRALERALQQSPVDARDRAFPFSPYANYFTQVIVGAHEFTEGAANISGLETPTDQQLVIHLTQPAGDLGARLALPAAAPIPPGVTEGHDNGYGRHLVATGPYMIEGADQLRPDLPPDQQPAVSGYAPGEKLTLVRNPSWDPALDSLRAAIPERVEVVQVNFDEQLQAVTDDDIDVALNLDLFPDEVDRLRADPATAGRLRTELGQASDWIMLNVAVPPFDDLAARRAIQFATNRQTLLTMVRPGGTVQTHAVPDIFANGLLSDYDPFGARDHAGDIAAAHSEMAKSVYDSDADGVCDEPACRDIPLPYVADRPELAIAAEAFSSQLASLGLTFRPVPTDFDEYWAAVTDPTSRTSMAFTVGWTSDYLNGSSWFAPLARSSSIGQDFGLNLSLIGASADDLASWGYDVTSVPTVDAKIDECVALTGAAQFQCWAALDQFMTERVAAWVPIGTRRVTTLTSSLVSSFEFDDSLSMASLNRIKVTRE